MAQFEVQDRTQGSDRKDPELDNVRADTFGAEGVSTVRDTSKAAPLKGDGFEIVDQTKVAQAKPDAPANSIDMKKMEEYADRIEYAANGGIGITTDEKTITDILLKLNKKEYEAVDDIFARKHGVNYAEAGKRWGIKEELKDELDEHELKIAERIIESKDRNEVPEEFRVSGESLLKPGSNLKVGELNQVNLGDGRSYSVYIPRNADSRAPVIVAMHGAAMGDNKGTMEAESGLIIDAEVQGSIMVFATPKVRNYDVDGFWANTFTFGSVDGVAWNVPGEGRQDLPKAESEDYNDQDYIDSIKNDLDGKMKTSEKIGMFGFSDGGRFAQTYAADRPDKIAAVVSMDGTWMEGDRLPTEKMPVLIIHGDKDETLKYDGTMGETGKSMDETLETNIDKSRPYMQKEVWRQVNGLPDTPEIQDGDKLKITTYGGSTDTPVKEMIVKGGVHALHDPDNNGDVWIQWALGEPIRDPELDLATESARFLKQYIVKGS